MLDNLRNETSFQPGPEDEAPQTFEPEKPARPAPKPRQSFDLDRMTRMKAPQRFMLAVMLAIVVCLLGTALLVLTGKVVLPVGF